MLAKAWNPLSSAWAVWTKPVDNIAIALTLQLGHMAKFKVLFLFLDIITKYEAHCS